MVNHLNLIALVLVFILPRSKSITFNFPNFTAPGAINNIMLEGNARSSNGGDIQLTNDEYHWQIGRASYAHPVDLWSAKNNTLADFTTRFSFRINMTLNKCDGISFFLVPFDSRVPPKSYGGYLGLFNESNAYDNTTHTNQVAAVAFDTYQNDEFGDQKGDRVCIDINSITPKAQVAWDGNFTDGNIVNAWISYNSATHNLSVFVTNENIPVLGGNSTLWYVTDLRTVLPETVRVGFSAATGNCLQTHSILSWGFSSALNTLNTSYTPYVVPKPKKSGWLVIVYILVPICVFFAMLGLAFCIIRKRRKQYDVEDMLEDMSMNDEFENGTGAKRFTFGELSRATKDFSEQGKLGEGGFGGVYKGLLGTPSTEIAVKRISRGSSQGKKEYASEVRIISRLRHRNLVQLIGWCHEKRELLLVYEYMPNGSLDSHLFGHKDPLSWAIRFKVANGLASALLYLHEEWEQCVLHRDVKSSNVMLDSEFNTKLGDFGLARFVGHGQGPQTTVLAGTLGYLAPECLSTGKSSKESDVYSFGAVVLEIACGRKVIVPTEESCRLKLVDFVWDLYGEGKLLEAVDARLNMEFDEAQMECLMIVGLWCCHPDHSCRPTIRQVINVLTFETPVPNLPSKQPVPTYYEPPMDMSGITYTSSKGFVKDSEKYHMTSTNMTKSSMFQSSSMALLHS